MSEKMVGGQLTGTAEKVQEVAAKAMVKEITDLLNGRFVVSEANREIVTTMLRLAEVMAYGAPRTPRRSHHHGAEPDPVAAEEARQRQLRLDAAQKLTPEERRALGLP